MPDATRPGQEAPTLTVGAVPTLECIAARISRLPANDGLGSHVSLALLSSALPPDFCQEGKRAEVRFQPRPRRARDRSA